MSDSWLIGIIIFISTQACYWLGVYMGERKGKKAKETVNNCGGCQGIGSHKRHCRQNPGYDHRLELADQLDSMGDEVGGYDHAAANHIYTAEGILRSMVKEKLLNPQHVLACRDAWKLGRACVHDRTIGEVSDVREQTTRKPS